MRELKELLEKVAYFVEKDRQEQESRRQKGENFNVFNVLGLWSEEVRLHSAFLAELLDVDGSHGQKDAFLKAFIQNVINDFEFPTLNSQTEVEKRISPISEDKERGGQIDILVISAEQAIIIENKIYAGDQENQLLRYDNYAKDNKFDYRLLYLTLYGHDPSELSVGVDDNVNCIPISYKEDIIRWLDECITLSESLPSVCEAIKQYQTLIKQLTNQDMGTQNKDNILEQIINKENFAAAKAIADIFSSEIDKNMINIFVLPQLERIKKELNVQLFVEDNQNYSWDYVFIFSKPDSKYEIYFDAGKGGLLNYRCRIRPKDNRELLSFECYFQKFSNWKECYIDMIKDNGFGIYNEIKMQVENAFAKIDELEK